MNSKEKLHPILIEMKKDLKNGAVSRREFLRYASLLGASAATVSTLGGITFPESSVAATVKRGGVLKVSQQIQKIDHPARYTWIMPSNAMRQVLEYMTFTDENNITRPYLCESWSASDDLKTWTFNVRKNVTFNNGDTLTADDCIFTIGQWLDKEVKSSLLGLVGSYLDPAGIEKTGEYQFKLHLKRPEIAVPEHFFMYMAQVVNHRTFDGDIKKAPHGTGPFTLDTYKEGEICILKARKDYWQKGNDGKPLPYIDEIRFIDMGGDLAPQIAALKAGDIDLIDSSDNVGPRIMKAVKNDDHIEVISVTTATTRVLRMRVDIKPWDDNRVRMALKLCQNREKILALAYQGEGTEGEDVHVYPNHPEYCDIPVPKYQPEKAKQLLKEAGYPEGIDVNLAVASEWSDVVRYAEVLKQDAAPAGFRINIQTMPSSQYWEKWTEVDLGITPWTHRPLGTMVLNLAYTSDDDGKPVPWNETRWVDEEFNELLAKASGIYDVKERRKVFCELEKIMQERGPIGIAYWMNLWLCPNKKIKNLLAHPNKYLFLKDIFLDG
ncbi:ABC transporter substrate-binding protein [Desulforhopalus singaporensis]|uniref:Peptide/nickel transport system substrate-binding protein n=1 Tax=Desulforhopalus singaporensis TaxID=91360 RepID=A0A1H0VGU7_9BACT|nr:ABC transporter substrate-binding protein [Desulforhopalus singaporensis]SDP77707.1 peptide/nickel transport system substrate-binding protein [Desulforhopalus singaporensis]